MISLFSLRFRLLALALFVPLLAHAQTSATAVVTTTATVSQISSGVAVGGSLTSLGTSSVTSRGFCWSSTGTPTIANDTEDLGAASDTGSFADTLAGLVAGTTYWVRAYATNASGTTYGDTVRLTTASFAGSGTKADPYQVATLADLRWLSEHRTVWSNNFVQTANIDASETKGWNDSLGFSPIGDSVINFTGSYNGKYHSIVGLTIRRPSANYVGLFGIFAGYRIDSVILKNVSIEGGAYVGGIVGYAVSGSRLLYDYVSGNVNGTGRVGGIVGWSRIAIAGCGNSARVQGNVAGGIVGWFYTGSSDEVVRFCYNTGNISGEWAGGLVGSMDGGIQVGSCYNSGNITGSAEAGGLIGDAMRNGSYNAGIMMTIDNTYNTGDIQGDNYVGGLIGNLFGASRYVYASYLDSSFSVGKIISSSSNNSAHGLFGSVEAAKNGETSLSGYWNTETAGSGITDSYGTGLTTTQMKKSGNFGFTFSTGYWKIRQDSTYPGLDYFGVIDNAPFAFADTLHLASTFSLDTLLRNDHDVDSAAPVLVLRVDSLSSGTTDSASSASFSSSAMAGDTLRIVYRVGKVRAAWGDTLWGNRARSLVILQGTRPSGLGTAASPFLIDSLSNLVWLSQTPSVWDSVMQQTADIDASPTATRSGRFAPIGDSATPFKGTYHGHGHVITGLVIHRPSSNFVGLFGHLAGASLDSLGLEAASVQGSTYVGILSGHDSASSVTYCHASGSDSGNLHVGGLVGLQTGSAITASYAVASVQGCAGGGCGGLVGHNDNGSTIAQSFSQGKVSASGNWVGGLVGVNMAATVVSSYSRDTVSGSGSVGGLVGYNFAGTIRGSYSAGPVTSGGGLVGSNTGTVDSSFWDSTTSGQKTSNGGAARSTALMQTQGTFTDSAWDFANTWTQYQGHTYPLLRAFLTPLTVAVKDSTKVYDKIAFAGGGLTYSLATVDKSLILVGTASFGGTSQGAVDTGHYTLTVLDTGLWSTQLGYLFGYSTEAASLVITAKPLTLSGVSASDKVYDGTTTATLSGGALDSVVTGDAVSLVAGTGSFADKAVGTAKTVTATGYSLSGTNAGNYTLRAQPTGLKASITAYPVTVSAIAASKTVGANDPVFTYTASSLFTGDSWSGALSRDTGSSVGTYVIRLGSLSAGPNYSIAYDSALFTITATTGIIGSNPSRLHTVGSVDLSAARILPSAAQGIASAQLGLSSCQDAGTCQNVGILLPESGTISVHIFDLLGTPVISWSQSVDSSALATLDATSDGRHVANLSWNLRAGNGVAVPAGVYLWKIEVETTSGQKLETVKKLGVK